MRKIALGMAVAAAALASPALARDGHAYFGADIGFADPEDHNVINNGWKDGTRVYEDDGFDLGAFIGYDWGAIRTEAEVGYYEYAPKGIDVGLVGAPLVNSSAPFESVTGAQLAGESRVTTIMANALFDLGGNNGIGFSIGGGVGRAILHSEFQATPYHTYLDDTDAAWAYQAIAAVRLPVTDEAELGLKYKYLNTNEFSMLDSALRSYQTQLAIHSFSFSLIANLGRDEPPPPPPPPVCNKGPYIVFFDWDKSDITPEAATILDSAITAYGNCRNVPIMLAGHADRSGSATYNVGLSERRNASVQSYLTGHGIPAGAITSQGFGESMPRVPTADGVRELQNRRVEITYGPGSGN
ncbi:OmpA family protein [Altererythrobacter salegens]|uniref:OmpA family protein n=1 Tax=Croceibacterium salegens TaxID=1737568 RepID=A0A6I4SW21_9SPHN|nr:OmpA family protein [Croceibacterium salegens]MXO60314.1 OmpA family protein [Croceibacterium salegens]